MANADRYGKTVQREALPCWQISCDDTGMQRIGLHKELPDQYSGIRWKASRFLLNIPEILWDTPSATGSCIAVLRSDCGTIPVPGRGKSPSPCGMLHSSGPLPLQKVKSGVTFHSQARNT